MENKSSSIETWIWNPEKCSTKLKLSDDNMTITCMTTYGVVIGNINI